jgi:hypothetical protein
LRDCQQINGRFFNKVECSPHGKKNILGKRERVLIAYENYLHVFLEKLP